MTTPQLVIDMVRAHMTTWLPSEMKTQPLADCKGGTQPRPGGPTTFPVKMPNIIKVTKAHEPPHDVKRQI